MDDMGEVDKLRKSIRVLNFRVWLLNIAIIIISIALILLR